jgi:DNA-binding XRE family transcriptional regulator
MADKPNPHSNLVKLREELELTQREIAEAIGVTEQTVRNWEQGKAIPRLTIPQMKTLCRLLKRSIDEVPDSFGPNKNAEA